MANRNMTVPYTFVNNGKHNVILTGVSPIKEFADGKYTDKILGTYVDAVFPAHAFDKVTFAVDTINALSDITEEEIRTACETLKPLWICFQDGYVSAYVSKGKLCLSGKAKGVELAQAQSK